MVFVDILDGDILYPFNITIDQVADLFSSEQIIFSVDEHEPDLPRMLHVLFDLPL